MAKTTDDTKTTEPKSEKAPRLEKGSAVHLVHANGSRVPATVTAVHKNGTVDLETDAGLVITGSPQGEKPDMWCWPAADVKAD